MSKPTSAPPPARLPLVVQVGFAGARDLFDPQAHPHIDAAALEAALQGEFTRTLQRELQTLEFGLEFFLCGISQIAIGGDTLFTRACAALGMTQRIFLPQPRDEYLNAAGSAGPDFTDAQRVTARDLLASPHIIQERVVSVANTRRDRFHDVNLEIVRVGDLIVGLVGAQQSSKLGGTNELIDLGLRHGRAVLEMQVEVTAAGTPALTCRWHGRDRFKHPALPNAITGATLPANAVHHPLPSVDDYSRGLKDFASGQANWERRLFKAAAAIIIGAHVLATIIAVVALELHDAAVPFLLGVELLLVAAGFGVHQYLHGTHRLERWALARLTAEVARSLAAIGSFPVYLEHLFTLPFPPAFRPLLHTLSVLHLHSTTPASGQSWQAQRDSYVQQRLVLAAAKAQIPYYKDTQDMDLTRLNVARRFFLVFSPLAFVATLIKLVVLREYLPVDRSIEDALTSVMGSLAVVFPVIAVAALSLAAAFDLEARVHTSAEMLAFLNEQKALLQNASSPRECSRLLIETESRLLGETVNWYARRSFLGVA